MKKTIGVSIAILFMVVVCSFRKERYGIAIPHGWPKPVYNFRRHPLTPEKVALGRLLFYDPVLSRDSTISCASCHSPYNAFAHTDHALSHGIEGKMGTRNAPALMNLAWSSSFMWDGAVEHLDEQALKPISNALEMDENMPHIVGKLQRDAKYRTSFYNAFGDSAISDGHLLQAIAQFMLTLVSADAKYDRVKNGTDTFTAREASGYRLFQRSCGSCHAEPLFTNDGFENNGLTEDDSLHDHGQMKITGKSSDSLKFKVPTLRNVMYTAPYMHDGRFKTLNMVLNNYMMGIAHGPTLSPKLQHGVVLTAHDKSDLIAFLSTLTDKAFLTDARYGYPGK